MIIPLRSCVVSMHYFVPYQGPDFMVRNAKRSMLEELEGMLEIVDPQPPGKPRTLSRRKFELPEGGAIPKEMRDGVKNVVRIVEEGK